jgi:hypothetical protein
VELQAALLTRLASFSSDDRGQVLSNIPSDARQADALKQLLNTTPGDDNTKSRLATFALAFPSEARGRAMDLVSTVASLGSNSPDSTLSRTQQAKLDNAIGSLKQLAAENGVSKTLGRLADPSVSSNDYGAAAEKLESLFKAAANSPTKELHLAIQAGALGLDDAGNPQASIYGGVEGTGQLNRFLRVMADRYAVTLKVTAVTDKLNAPVVQKVNNTLGIYDINDINSDTIGTDENRTNNPRTIAINTTHPTHVEIAPSGRWNTQDRTNFLNERKPDAVISVGHSANNNGAKSLIEAARGLGIPTIALAGHYDQDGSARATLNAAEHGLAEDTADTAAAKLMNVLADRQDASQGRADGSFKANLPSVHRVSQAYEAAEKSGAIRDDQRFAEGVSNNTRTVRGLVGQRSLLYYDNMRGDSSVGSPREPNGLERFTAGYQGPSAQDQLRRINQLHESAQPGVRASDQLKSLPFLYSQASAGEKARIATVAGASVGASIFLGKEVFDFLVQHQSIPTDTGYVITAVGGFGTALRQAWISRVAGLERLASLRGVAADPNKQRADLRSFGGWLNGKIDRSMANDPEADAFNNRRRSNFVMTGFLTYPVSITADAYLLANPGHPSTAGEVLMRIAAGTAAAGLGMVEAQYTREALSMRLGPDGKATADPTFKPGGFGKVVDLARLPLALSGGLNIAEFTWLAPHTGFNDVTTVPNWMRNFTNIDKAAVVWLYQPQQNRKLKANNNEDGPKTRLFEAVDGAVATYTGTLPTIWSSATTLNPQVEHGAASLASWFGEGVTNVVHLLGEYTGEGR